MQVLTRDARPDWQKIRAEYVASDCTVAQICRTHSVSRSALQRKKSEQGWPARASGRSGGRGKKTVSRSDLIARMYRVLENQLQRMEQASMEQPCEKEFALLGQMVRTLEKLADLDAKVKADAKAALDANPDASGKGRRHADSPQMRQLRQKIAQRLMALERE
ncbi:MAG TPA: hypothetical protein ENJ68_05785 [Devosia sp.]|nr:hypothetical protein [Devosia sp.]